MHVFCLVFLSFVIVFKSSGKIVNNVTVSYLAAWCDTADEGVIKIFRSFSQNEKASGG